jgi:hypothetical protein
MLGASYPLPPYVLMARCFDTGTHLKHGSFERNLLETKSVRVHRNTRKEKKMKQFFLPLLLLIASLDAEGRGRLEAYRMTDEEAARGTGRTEASSILVAMHHGM